MQLMILIDVHCGKRSSCYLSEISPLVIVWSLYTKENDDRDNRLNELKKISGLKIKLKAF